MMKIEGRQLVLLKAALVGKAGLGYGGVGGQRHAMTTAFAKRSATSSADASSGDHPA